MIGFLLRRIVALFSILFIASFLIFGALYIAPGKPETFLVGGRTLSPEILASIREQYGLNDPFLVRYWHWLSQAATGDFGQSLVNRQDVSSLLVSRLPTTMTLALMASALIVVLGVGLGVLAGWRGGWVDTAIVSVSGFGLAVPTFFAAAILMNLLAVQTPIFPVFGSGQAGLDRLWHLTLPAMALALPSTAVVARITRTAVLEERHSEHVALAFTRGIQGRLIMRRHVLRNALMPISTIVGVNVAGLIAGAAIVEHAFTLNGVGALLVDAVQQKDFAVVQAVSLLLVVSFGLMNLTVDMLYAALDPRVQTGGALR
jgi:peptide/nickel transport system permease protein